jgi:hypothetical protein
MAYCIFLKSLRSLGEFRKILVSKFLLNLLVQISKALINSKKIQFLIRNSFFLFTSHFRPSWPYWLTWPLAQPAPPASFPPQAEAILAGLSGPCVDGVSVEIRFSFRFAPSELVAFSLVSLCQVYPGCQLRLPPYAGQPRLRHR